MSRPRDPELAARVITAAATVLAVGGMPAYTADEVSAAAGIGKASLYRRWRHMDDLLVDVVGQLGIDGPIHPAGQGTLRGDLDDLLTAACTGGRALAEVAALPRCGTDERIRRAYMEGPRARLLAAVTVLGIRADARGEDVARLIDPVLAAVTVLQWEIAVQGLAPTPGTVEHVVDTVVLPAVQGAAVTA